MWSFRSKSNNQQNVVYVKIEYKQEKDVPRMIYKVHQEDISNEVYPNYYVTREVKVLGTQVTLGLSMNGSTWTTLS